MMPRSAWLLVGNNRCPTSCAMVWPSSRLKSSPYRLASSMWRCVRMYALTVSRVMNPNTVSPNACVSAQLRHHAPREQQHVQRESTWVRTRLRAMHPADPDPNGLVDTCGFSLRRRQFVRLNRGVVAHVRDNRRLATIGGFPLLSILDRRLTGQDHPGSPHPREYQNADPLDTPGTAHGTSSAAGVSRCVRTGAGLLTRI